MARSNRAAPERPTFIEEARRKQIIEAARDIFLITGFERSTISQIAEAIRVSKGVILYHFGSKSDLGKAVLEEILSSYGAHITDELNGIDDSAEKILSFPVICASYFESHQDEFILYLDTLGSFGDIEEKRSYMAHANATQRKYLVRLINKAKRDGAFSGVNSREFADTIQAFVDGLSSQYCADPEKVSPSASAKTFRKMLKLLS